MKDFDLPISKMLVLDPEADALAKIRTFCDSHRVQGLRVGRNNVLSVLKSNLDLGGLLLCEDAGAGVADGHELLRKISSSRPDLPIFLRRHGEASQALPIDIQYAVAASYRIDTIATIEPALERMLFSVAYPTKLVRGVIEFFRAALQDQFRGLEVTLDQPYLVRDQFIYGEMFTLIPVESDWCRGYMLMQTGAEPLEQLIRAGHSLLPPEQADDFRTMHHVLGELTNVVWGAFKNRYQGHDAATTHQSQVPIVVNHLNRYISFGSSIPQLCVRAVLRDPKDDCLPETAFQLRLVFNLAWSPEDFRENEATVNSLVSAGEIEFF